MANNLAAFNSEAWSPYMAMKLNQLNVMLPLVNRNWEGDLRNNRTVHVRTRGNLAMSTYTKGLTLVSQDLTPTDEEFTVNDFKYLQFACDDIDKAQSDINAMAVYADAAVIAMNNTVEAKLLSTYSSAAVTIGAVPTYTTKAVLTPVITAGAVSSVTITSGGTGYTSAPILQFVGGDGNGATATCALTSGVITSVTVTAGGNNYTIAPSVIQTTATGIVADSSTTAGVGIYPLFTQAWSIHSKQNVPLGPGSRWSVVDPDTATLLFNDTAHFVRATNLGDNVVMNSFVGGEMVTNKAKEMNGFIGTVAGYSVFVCNHTPTSGGNKFILFGDNQAISYASQITRVDAFVSQTTFADVIRALLVHDTFVPAEASKRLIAMKLQPAA